MRHLADDNTLGRLVRACGLHARLAPTVCATMVPEIGLGALFRHELRWGLSYPVARACRVRCVSRPVSPVAWAAFAVAFSGGAAWALGFFAFSWAGRAALARDLDERLGLVESSLCRAGTDLASAAARPAQRGRDRRQRHQRSGRVARPRPAHQARQNRRRSYIRQAWPSDGRRPTCKSTPKWEPGRFSEGFCLRRLHSRLAAELLHPVTVMARDPTSNSVHNDQRIGARVCTMMQIASRCHGQTGGCPRQVSRWPWHHR